MTDHKLFHVEINFQNRGQSTFRTHSVHSVKIIDECFDVDVSVFYDPFTDSTTAFRSKDVLAVIVKEVEDHTNPENVE